MKALRLGLIAAWLAAAALAAGGCAVFGGGGGAKGGDDVGIEFIGAPMLNSCGKEKGNGLAIRVYQLAGDSRIAISALGSLWGNEEKELGKDLIEQSEFFLEPGGKVKAEIVRAPGSQIIAVVGNYCKTEGECWKWYGRYGRVDKLTFEEFCIKESREGKK